MKNSHPLLLVAVSLTLALCACDDKKDTSAPLPVGAAKPPKPPKEPVDAANPAPPESTEPVKAMNAGAAPTDVAGSADMSKFPGVDVINGAISSYAVKMQQSASMSQMADAGKLDKNAMKKKYMDAANKKSGTASTVTSLDQLVSAGIIKSIPEPPAGQKYVLDVKAQKVRLEKQ